MPSLTGEVYPMSWYIIKGLGPWFDGLFAYAPDAYQDKRFIQKFVNRNVMFGDREVSLTIPDGGLLIRDKFLEKTEDPELRQFDNKNPWGKYVCEGRLSKSNIEVSWAEYEYNIQVTVQEKIVGQPTKTLYSVNFDLNDYSAESVVNTIQDSIRDDDSLDDLIFNLKDIQNDG